MTTVQRRLDSATTWLRGRRWLAVAPYAVLVALNVLFRLPLLINSAGVHSDAAVVGLQAMHILQGEHQPFIWGTDYQLSFDAYVVAAMFAFLGPTPLALMLAPLLGHLLLVGASYFALSRVVPRGHAFFLCLALVFTPTAINGVVAYAPRQWSITAAFCAVAIAGSGLGSSTVVGLLAAGIVGWMSPSLDLFGLLFMPSLALLLLSATFDDLRHRRQALMRCGAATASLMLGWLAFRVLRDQPGASNKQASLVFDRPWANLPLLIDTCLPWVLGVKAFVPGPHLYPDLWQPSRLVIAWQKFAGYSSLMLAALALPLTFAGRLAWTQKRFGLFGLSLVVGSLVGFLLSTLPADMWAARYLAPVVWGLPFALAPLAAVVSRRALALLFAPYLINAALAGWLGYGDYVAGAWPRQSARGGAQEEQQVGHFLRSQGVQAAAAQYWLAYRLGFLWREKPVVVPLARHQDRHWPDAQRFDRSRRVAYIFHASEPRAVPADVMPALHAAGSQVEEVQVAGFTVLLVDRRPTQDTQ